MSHTNPSELIAVELERLRNSQVVFFTDNHDIVVGMKNLVNQIIQCYATTNPKHTLKLMLRMAAILTAYFGVEVTGLPRGEHRSMGHGILMLSNSISRAEEALVREGRMDAKSHLTTALATLHKLIGQYGES